MKLSPLLTKIAALLVVSAKAVNGQCADGSECLITQFGQVLPPNSTYCNLRDIDPGVADAYCQIYNEQGLSDANVYATVVMTSLSIDNTGAFLATCLQDLLEAFQISMAKQNRRECKDGKTEIALFSTVETSSIPANSTEYNVVDGIVKNDFGWNTAMCKSPACDATVLQQVLTATFLDFYDTIDPKWKQFGWKATSTVTPTAECVYDKIGAAPLNNPELYCTADAPTCSNMKLVELTLADDAPFEVAICDDNDCLASVGAVDIPGYFATGTMDQSYAPREVEISSNDPFCMKDLESKFARRNQKYISAKISDKVFDKTKYCTVAAASARAGKCPCSDSATYEFKVEFSGKMEKCSWITKNNLAKKDAARTKKFCADTQTKFQCAKTCSNCRGCADTSGYTFVLPNVENTVSCSYITKNIKRTATRKKNLCPLQGHACPKSCGYCPA